LDGSPSAWGECEPYPASYKCRTGWHYDTLTKGGLGCSPCRGSVANTADKTLIKGSNHAQELSLVIHQTKSSPAYY